MPEEVNVVKTDNPARYLVTYEYNVTKDCELKGKRLVETTIIETEPSLWWRKQNRSFGCDMIILNTWYIGGGDG
jgi:hypothetical protein